ncbi:phospholipase, patatin family protein [Toxoplasma gondii VEG]|uniref:Patatin-like phospholipase domain-containing protein n=1 Tax=Toxoplasma gondii (strain ATCC 50861 / VEG) TaxID=432359 RepID=B9Q4Z1_TOXGV|nr:phospholipase, patatin family protein [Toxoplasma gondii VEG]CEL74841.1 TPA: patatin-like phospholipase domain-containing protein [Toxoplasma gondii VEG]
MRKHAGNNPSGPCVGSPVCDSSAHPLTVLPGACILGRSGHREKRRGFLHRFSFQKRVQEPGRRARKETSKKRRKRVGCLRYSASLRLQQRRPVCGDKRGGRWLRVHACSKLFASASPLAAPFLSVFSALRAASQSSVLSVSASRPLSRRIKFCECLHLPRRRLPGPSPQTTSNKSAEIGGSFSASSRASSTPPTPQRHVHRPRRKVLSQSRFSLFVVFLLISVVLAICYAVAESDRASLSLASLPLAESLPHIFSRSLFTRTPRSIPSFCKVSSSVSTHKLACRVLLNARRPASFRLALKRRGQEWSPFARATSSVCTHGSVPSSSFLFSPFSSSLFCSLSALSSPRSSRHSSWAADPRAALLSEANRYVHGKAGNGRDDSSCSVRAPAALLLASSLALGRPGESYAADPTRKNSPGRRETLSVSSDPLSASRGTSKASRPLALPPAPCAMLSSPCLSPEEVFCAPFPTSSICSEEGDVDTSDEGSGSKPTEETGPAHVRREERRDSLHVDDGEESFAEGSEESKRRDRETAEESDSNEAESGDRRGNAFASDPERKYQVEERGVLLSMSSFSSPSGSALAASSSFSHAFSSLRPPYQPFPSDAPSPYRASSSASSKPAWRTAASGFTPGSRFSFASSAGSSSGRENAAASETSSAGAKFACGSAEQPRTEEENSRDHGAFHRRRTQPGEGRGWPLFSLEDPDSGEDSEGSARVKREGEGEDDQEKNRERGSRRKDDGHDKEEGGCNKQIRESEQKEDQREEVPTRTETDSEERKVTRNTFQEIAASAACSILIRTLLFRGDGLSLAARSQIVQSLFRIAETSVASPVSLEARRRQEPVVLLQMLDEDIFAALLPFLLSNSEQDSVAVAALRSAKDAPASLWRRWMWRQAHEKKDEFCKGKLEVPVSAAAAEEAHAQEKENERQELLEQLRMQQREARRNALLLIHLLAKKVVRAVKTHRRTPALAAALERLKEKREAERDGSVEREQRVRRAKRGEGDYHPQSGKAERRGVEKALEVADGAAETQASPNRKSLVFSLDSPCDTLSTAEEVLGDDASSVVPSSSRLSPVPSMLRLESHHASAFSGWRTGARDEPSGGGTEENRGGQQGDTDTEEGDTEGSERDCEDRRGDTAKSAHRDEACSGGRSGETTSKSAGEETGAELRWTEEARIDADAHAQDTGEGSAFATEGEKERREASEGQGQAREESQEPCERGDTRGDTEVKRSTKPAKASEAVEAETQNGEKDGYESLETESTSNRTDREDSTEKRAEETLGGDEEQQRRRGGWCGSEGGDKDRERRETLGEDGQSSIPDDARETRFGGNGDASQGAENDLVTAVLHLLSASEEAGDEETESREARKEFAANDASPDLPERAAFTADDLEEANGGANSLSGSSRSLHAEAAQGDTAAGVGAAEKDRHAADSFFSRLLGLPRRDKRDASEAGRQATGEAKLDNAWTAVRSCPAQSSTLRASVVSPFLRSSSASTRDGAQEPDEGGSVDDGPRRKEACSSENAEAREKTARLVWIPVLISDSARETEIIRTSLGAADPRGKLLDSLTAWLAERSQRDETRARDGERETEREGWDEQEGDEERVLGETEVDREEAAWSTREDTKEARPTASENAEEGRGRNETTGQAAAHTRLAEERKSRRLLDSLGSEDKGQVPQDKAAADLAEIIHDRSFFVTEGGTIATTQEERRKSGRPGQPRTGDDDKWGLLGVYVPAELATDASTASPSHRASLSSLSSPRCSPPPFSPSPFEIVALFRGPELVRWVSRFVSPSCPLLAGDPSRELEQNRGEKLLRLEGLRLLLAGAQSSHEEVRSGSLDTLLRMLTRRTREIASTADELARTAGTLSAQETPAKRSGDASEKDERTRERTGRTALVDLLVRAVGAAVESRRRRSASGAAEASWDARGEAAGLEMLYELCVLSPDWLHVLQTHTGLYLLLFALSLEFQGAVKLPRKPSPASPLAFAVAPPVLRHARASARLARRLRFVSILRAALGFDLVAPPACLPPSQSPVSPSARAGRRRGLRILCFDGGGTRGVLSLALLKQIMACVGQEVHETFDIICGTSTGGVIAALLGLEKATVSEAERLYDLLIREIFVRDSAAVTGARLVLRQALYNEKGWEGILERAWGRRRMIDFAADPACPKVFCVSTVASPNPTQVMVWRNYNFPVRLVPKAAAQPRGRETPPNGDSGDASEPTAKPEAGRESQREARRLGFVDWWRKLGTKESGAPQPEAAGREARDQDNSRLCRGSAQYSPSQSVFSRFAYFFRPPHTASGSPSRQGRPDSFSPYSCSSPCALPSPSSFLLVPSRGSRHAGSSRILVKDALRATTAAPGFFSGIFWEGQAFSDGALLANNPTAVALAEARGLYGEDVPIDLVVSIGTGKFPSSFSSPSRGDSLHHREEAATPAESDKGDTLPAGWSSLLGLGGWETLLAQLANCATNTEAVHDLLSDLLPQSVYFRFNPDISGDWPIDETRTQRLDVLKCLAERFFLDNAETQRRLAELANRLREGREDTEGDTGRRAASPGQGEEEVSSDDEWEDLGEAAAGGEAGEGIDGREQARHELLASERRHMHAKRGMWNSFLSAILPRKRHLVGDQKDETHTEWGVGERETDRDERESVDMSVERAQRGSHIAEGQQSSRKELHAASDLSTPHASPERHTALDPLTAVPAPSQAVAGAEPTEEIASRSPVLESAPSLPKSLWSWLAGKRRANAGGAGMAMSTSLDDGVKFSFAEKVMDVLSGRSEHQELHRQAFISAKGATERLPQASTRPEALPAQGDMVTLGRVAEAETPGRASETDETEKTGEGEEREEEFLVPPTGVQIVLQTIHTHLEEEVAAAEEARKERRRRHTADQEPGEEAIVTNQESHLREEQAMIHEAATENRRAASSRGSISDV